MKRKKNPPSPLSPLPEETVSYYGEHPAGTLFRRKMTGLFLGSRRVIYSLSLPHMESKAFGEAKAFLDGVAREYLAFLEEKSREGKAPLYGGLSFSPTKNGLTVTAALSPPDQREFFPVLTLFLGENGRLLSVKKEK